ncbi:MAG: 50S ribosomal protein L30 [Wenzhouxiangella sp.]|jgi:large subunit ribosomal protein L30|nr:50S ribosomal protein L30 [Wenzhouxiangella sp.]
MAKQETSRLRVTLIRSVAGKINSHRETVRGLGLRRMHHTVELEDTPAVRGMINKVNYLVRVEPA